MRPISSCDVANLLINPPAVTTLKREAITQGKRIEEITAQFPLVRKMLGGCYSVTTFCAIGAGKTYFAGGALGALATGLGIIGGISGGASLCGTYWAISLFKETINTAIQDNPPRTPPSLADRDISKIDD